MQTFYEIFSTPGILMLLATWAYMFVYSWRKNIGSYWGFSIVIVGVLVAGHGITFQYKNIAYFWISTSLIIMLFGLILNVFDLQNQVYIKDVRKTLSMTGIGLLFGLLVTPFFMASKSAAYIQQGSAKFTLFALLIGNVQDSIVEEFIFRGYLLFSLRKYGFGFRFATLYQALIFAIFHIRHYSDEWIILSVIFLFGILAAYITWKSDNLFPAFLMHIMVNLFVLIGYLSFGAGL